MSAARGTHAGVLCVEHPCGNALDRWYGQAGASAPTRPLPMCHAALASPQAGELPSGGEESMTLCTASTPEAMVRPGPSRSLRRAAGLARHAFWFSAIPPSRGLPDGPSRPLPLVAGLVLAAGVPPETEPAPRFPSRVPGSQPSHHAERRSDAAGQCVGLTRGERSACLLQLHQQAPTRFPSPIPFAG
jgi:hypothetical protein